MRKREMKWARVSGGKVKSPKEICDSFCIVASAKCAPPEGALKDLAELAYGFAEGLNLSQDLCHFCA